MQRLRKFEQALIAGEWFDHTKSTRTFGAIAVGVGLVVGAGADIYMANKQGQIANSQLGLEQDQQFKQDTAFQQLQT